MSVVPLTLTISLCLVFTFVLFFLREFTRRRFSGAESESLLPLADEIPRLATAHGAQVNAVFIDHVTAAAASVDVNNAKSGGSCNHSLDTAQGGSVNRDAQAANACTRNCAACRLRALHRGAANAITGGTVTAN